MRSLKTVLLSSTAALCVAIGGCVAHESASIGTPAPVIANTPPPATVVQQAPPVVIEKSSPPVIVEKTVPPPQPTVSTYERSESTSTEDSFGPSDKSRTF